MIRGFLSRQLTVPFDRVRPVIHLLWLGATLNGALVIAIAAAQSLFLTHLGASRLPVFYLLLAAAALPTAAVASALLARWSNRRLLASVIAAAALASLALRWLIDASPALAYHGALLVYSLVLMQAFALFSALLTEYLTSLELKRFVVFLTMMSAFGGLVGGLALRLASRWVSTPDVLLGLVAVFALIAWQLAALARSGEPLASREEAPPEGLFSHLGTLRRLAERYPMTALLAASSLLVTVIHSIFQVQIFAIFAREFPSEASLTAFLGMLNAGLKILEIVVAYTLTRPLIRRLGVAYANLVYPFTCLAAFIGLMISPVLPVALAATFNYRTLSNSLAGPVTTLNFNAVPQRWVGRVRIFVSSLVAPAGLVLSGVLLLVAQPRLSAGAITGLGVFLGGVYLALGWLTTRAYFRSLLAMLRARTVNLDEVAEGLGRLPDTQADAVGEMLRSDDPHQHQLALALLERIDWSLVEADLERLLERAEGPLARSIVEHYLREEADFFTHRGPRLLRVDNEAVRAAALEALLSTESAAELTDTGRRLGRELASDPSPQVRTMALVASYQLARSTESLAGSITRGPAGAQAAVLEALTRDGRSPKMLLIDEALSSAPVGVRVRVLEMLTAMAEADDADLLELARAQRAHPDPPVRMAAIDLIARACSAAELAEVAHGLDDDDPGVREVSVAALQTRAADCADTAIAVAEPYLAAQRPEVVASAITAIGSGGSRAAEEVLRKHLQGDLAAADSLRRWLRELPPADVYWQPLKVAVVDAAHRIRQRVFAVLSALGEESTLSRVRQLLRAPDPRLRANAIETFGSIRRPRLIQPILKLLEAERGAAAGSGESRRPQSEPEALLRRAGADRDPWIRRAAAYIAQREGIDLPHPTAPPERRHEITLHLQPVDSEKQSEVAMSRLLFLTRVPIFQQFTLDELSVIDAALEPMEFLAEETIFVEGRPGDRFFIVQEGKIVLTKLSGQDSFEIGRSGPGEYFGEMSLFDDSPRSATATAAEDTLLLALDRDRLRSLAHQKPEVAWAFCKELGMRLREANERLRSLSVKLKASA